MGESQGEQEQHRGKKEDSRAGALKGKSQLYSEERRISRMGRKASKESFPRRRRKHGRVNRPKSPLRGSGESSFRSRSTKPQMEKKVERFFTEEKWDQGG